MVEVGIWSYYFHSLLIMLPILLYESISSKKVFITVWTRTPPFFILTGLSSSSSSPWNCLSCTDSDTHLSTGTLVVSSEQKTRAELFLFSVQTFSLFYPSVYHLLVYFSSSSSKQPILLRPPFRLHPLSRINLVNGSSPCATEQNRAH